MPFLLEREIEWPPVGWHSHSLWSERLSRLRLDVRQAAMLLHVAAAEGKPQQVLVRSLHIPASRVVALVDELEQLMALLRKLAIGLHLSPTVHSGLAGGECSYDRRIGAWKRHRLAASRR